MLLNLNLIVCAATLVVSAVSHYSGEASLELERFKEAVLLIDFLIMPMVSHVALYLDRIHLVTSF